MALAPKTKLGPYEILAQIGAGGMGEVYRARDSRLERTVAIKILPADLSFDPVLKQRFEREAKTISSLAHPNICTLYDVGHQDGIDFLVMEYLEGQTLAERLSKGPLPLEDLLTYAMQISEALDRAHRQGIIHRDLKPGNIIVSKHGVKLLDFGLAKLLEQRPHQVHVEKTTEATKEDITEQGTILGTLQYMAPEQIEGREADARTDIFAFGIILYEMATGKKAFSGRSRANLMAAILERDPEPLSRVAPLIPPALERVIAGCLAKDPEERWQTAHDLKLQLRWILEGGSEAGVPQPVATHRKHREQFAWGLAAICVLVTLVVAFQSMRQISAKPRTFRFSIQPPENSFVHSLALSPDGRKLAFVANEAGGKQKIWLRSLDSLTTHPIPNTEDATFPTWSPDGTSIAFFAREKLKKVQVESGLSVVLCDAPMGRGITWGTSGVILFTPEPTQPLHQVSSAGGIPVPVTQHTEASSGHRWPCFLPDGKHFIFWGRITETNEVESGALFLGSLDSSEAKFLLHSRFHGIYSSGHLIFLNDNVLMSVPFDPKTRKVLGQPIPLAERVHSILGIGYGRFTGSEDGTLAFVPAGAEVGSQLVWYDLQGKQLESLSTPALNVGVQISPDGSLAVTTLEDYTKNSSDVWMYETDRGLRNRLTSHTARDRAGVFSPDGKYCVFSSNRRKIFDMYVKEVGSMQEEVLLYSSEEHKYATSWSPDGKHLLFNSAKVDGNLDLWVLPWEPREEPYLLLGTEFRESSARFSPDGHWITYVSNETGEREVFAISFPDRLGKIRISNGGGNHPRWAPDGRKIYFLNSENVLYEAHLAVQSKKIRVLEVSPLFTINPQSAFLPYDISPDGKRFLVNSLLGPTNETSMVIVHGWRYEGRN